MHIQRRPALDLQQRKREWAVTSENAWTSERDFFLWASNVCYERVEANRKMIGSLKNFRTRGIINATVTESDNKICDSSGLLGYYSTQTLQQSWASQQEIEDAGTGSHAAIVEPQSSTADVWPWGKRHSSWDPNDLMKRTCHRELSETWRNAVMCIRMSAL